MFNFIKSLFVPSSEKQVRHYWPRVEAINALEPEIQKLTDAQLQGKTAEFRQRIQNGETVDDLLIEAFAVVREASIRTLKMRHFDVQLIGGMVLHESKIAEMKTGEGKTLVGTLPVYLNSLAGQGVYVVTVNDYLARRDSEWMGKIYRFLGLSVGVIQHDLPQGLRKAAYHSDITYGTNNEFGFDYLRDNMAVQLEHCVQRTPFYAIIDEVDSILIDEARTPLIISGMVADNTDKYHTCARVAKRLNETEDYTLEEKTKNAILTEPGIHKVEKELGIDNIYDFQHMEYAHMVVACLKAWKLYKKDVDYVVRNGEIVIVDEFTGRLMEGRRYSDGLHQSIEAIEGVRIREESQTLASITFQNYFRMFPRLAGMTGTAKTEEEEFISIYGLSVVEIPTNQNMIRTDKPDVIYKTKETKYQAIINDIVDLHKKNLPVLVGTIAIETSELLSEYLKRRGIPHNVLNAKQNEREAEIIAQAGQPGQVTIATNMAGRGTDIVLGQGVATSGGLHVLGSERHESRRIDNQLRGRSGRQGDPGFTRFYISLQDDLMRMFGGDRIAKAMEFMNLPEDTPIENGMISAQIERAQKKVEQYHYGIRKQILQYDDVINKQRDTIYTLRRRILEGVDLKTKIMEIQQKTVNRMIDAVLPEKETIDPEGDYTELIIELKRIFPFHGDVEAILKTERRPDLIKDTLWTEIQTLYNHREQEIGSYILRDMERMVLLRNIDMKWIDHLHNMDSLREGIGLRAYGQRNPLLEYKMEAFDMFQIMMDGIEAETIELLYKVQVVIEHHSETEIIPTPTPLKPALETPFKNVSYGGGASVKQSKSVSTVTATAEKVGRNDPCSCGSGKKYKKCCGK